MQNLDSLINLVIQLRLMQKLIDFKIGVGTISCEESTGISGLDFRKIKFEIEAKIGITWEI